MEGIIVNFRRGRTRQKDRQMVIQVKGIDDKKKANTLIGKAVVFKTESGKEIKGRVSAAHGNKGAIRAIFERGMPGQSLSKKVSLD